MQNGLTKITKTIDTVVEDIYALLEGKTIADPEILSKFGPELGKILSQRLKSKSEEREPTLRMSNIGRPLRQLWYELNKYKGESLKGQTHLKFLYGDLTESLILVLAEVAGHKIECLQEQIEVDEILGHIDAKLDGVLIDVKSCSAYSFRKFKDGSLLDPGNDPFGYVAQLCGYAHALNLPAAWIAFDKQSGEICVLHLPKQTIDEYDVTTRISLVRTTCSQQEPPDRCYPDEADGKSGNRKLSVGCSYCGYKLECWKDSNNGEGLKTYIYSTGPRFLTNVTREPKVFSINESNS